MLCFLYAPQAKIFAILGYVFSAQGRRGGRGFVHLAAGTRKSGQWSLVPSYGWGLDYPKVLHKFRSFGKK